MLEGLLARFLSSRVGHFVDGVDQNNLNVGLWKGEILLHDLRVKGAAVDDLLGLIPLGLAWGRVGTFHLSVPWNAFGTKPLVITLKDVTLVFRVLTEEGSRGADGGDGGGGGASRTALRRRRAAKEREVQERLRYLQASKQRNGEGNGVSVQEEQERRGLAERLFASLLENVQLRLSNVHVRLEYKEEGSFVRKQQDGEGAAAGGDAAGEAPKKREKIGDDCGHRIEGNEVEEEEPAGPVRCHGHLQEDFLGLGLEMEEFTIENHSAPGEEGIDDEGEEEEEGEEGQVDASARGLSKGQSGGKAGMDVRTRATTVRKRALVTNLALYCDPHSPPWVPSSLPPSRPSSTVAPGFHPLPVTTLVKHDYLLRPTSGALMLIARPVPLSPKRPKHDLSCHLTDVHVGTTLAQIRCLRALVHALTSTRRVWEDLAGDRSGKDGWKGRRRPLGRVTDDPRGWWQYAAGRVLRGKEALAGDIAISPSVAHSQTTPSTGPQDAGGLAPSLPSLPVPLAPPHRLGSGLPLPVHPPHLPTWPQLVSLVQTRHRYLRLHPRRALLLPAEAQSLQDLDDRLEVEEIVFLRLVAQARPKDADASQIGGLAGPQAEQEAESTVVGWVKSWFEREGGRNGGDDGAIAPPGSGETTEGKPQDPELVSAADRLALEETALDYARTLAQVTIPPTYVITRLSLSLNQGSCTLYLSPTRPLARLVVDAASTFLLRPFSWSVTMALGALEVLDLDPLTKYRTVVTRKIRRRAAPTPATSLPPSLPPAMMVVGTYRVPKNADLQIHYNKGCEEGGRDLAVSCRVLPFEVFYSRRLLEALRHVCMPPLPSMAPRKGEEESEGGTEGVRHGVQEWQARQRARLLSRIADRGRILLDIDIQAPLILIPETTRAEEGQLLVLDLGCVVLCNREHGQDEGKEDEADTAAWTLRMQHMAVEMCRLGALFLELKENDVDLHPIVEPFDLTLDIQTCLDNAARASTHASIQASLPRLAVNLRASTIQYFHRVFHRRRSQARAKILADTPENDRHGRRVRCRDEGRKLGTKKTGARVKDLRYNSTAALQAPREDLSANVDSTPAMGKQDHARVKDGISAEEEEREAYVQAGRVLNVTFTAPNIALHLVDDLVSPLPSGASSNFPCSPSLFPLVDVAVQGIEGRIVAFAYQEAAKATTSINLEIAFVEIKDRHHFADASFSSLFGPLHDEMGEAMEDAGKGVSLLSVAIVHATRGENLSRSRTCGGQRKESTEVDIAVRPVQVQWNPETVAALQRFLAAQKQESVRNAREEEEESRQLRDRGNVVVESRGRARGDRIPPSDFHEEGRSFPTLGEDTTPSYTEGLGHLFSLYSSTSSTDQTQPSISLSSFRLSTRLRTVSILLNKEKELRRLLRLQLRGLDLTLKGGGKAKALQGSIQGLTVDDLGNADTCFPRVLDGQKKGCLALSFSYSSLLPPLVSEASAGCDEAEEGGERGRDSAKGIVPDNHLDVVVGPLQVVYYNHLCLEVIDYVNEGVLGAIISSTLRSADALVRQRAMAKTGFTVSLAHPMAILPRYLTHLDHALAVMDDAVLKTVFENLHVPWVGEPVVDENSAGNADMGSTSTSGGAKDGNAWSDTSQSPTVGQEYDIVYDDKDVEAREKAKKGEVIVLRRFDLAFSSAVISLESPALAGHPALFSTPFSFQVHVTRPLDVEYGNILARRHREAGSTTLDLPSIAVKAALPPLRLQASHESYSLLRRVVEDNLLTQEHHATNMLKALRALDLPPLATRSHYHRNAGAEEGKACMHCARAFQGVDDGAHTCPQCGDQICRRCLNVSVFDKSSAVVVRVCGACARASFPSLFHSGEDVRLSWRTRGQEQHAAHVAYSYGLIDGPLSDIKVDVHLSGLELNLLEPSLPSLSPSPSPANEVLDWRASAHFVIDETKILFRRPEDDRKILDVSLYRCLVDASSEVSRQVPREASILERILSPSMEALEKGPSGKTSGLSSSLPAPIDVLPSLPPALAPQFVYRYVSAPREPPITHLVLNHLNVVVLVSPLLYLASFFGCLAPDHSEGLGEKDEGVAKALEELSFPSMEKEVGKREGELLQGPTPDASPRERLSEEAIVQESSTSNRLLPSPAIENAPTDEAEEVLQEVIRRVKIMVHHPRIIFPERKPADGGREDRQSGGTKAVVMRGLGVGSYVQELERRLDGALLPRSKWNAHLDGLECFITSFTIPSTSISAPSPAFRSSQPPLPVEENVSLLNPTSVSLEYTRAYSLLRSPLRHLHLSLDSITTYISYQDLYILGRVVESWYHGNLAHERQVLPLNNPPEEQGEESAPDAANTRATAPVTAVGGYYELTFAQQKLGLMLRKVDGMAVVEGLSIDDENETKGERANRTSGVYLPRKGDVIWSINGKPSGDHSEVLRSVRTLPRPIILGFCPRGEPFTLNAPLSSVFLHRSTLPDCLLLSEKAVGEKGGDKEGRKATAMLVSVEGKSIEGLGYQTALATLKEVAAQAEYARTRGENCRTALIGVRHLGQPVCLQDLEVEIGSISLVAIDDLDGKDLPLLKSRARNLKTRVREWSYASGGREKTRAGMSIVLAGMMVNTQVDYYNGRFGAWEPLLEPVGVSGSVRRETASDCPASLHGLVSDRTITTTLTLSTTDALCLNITDALLELAQRISRGPKSSPSQSVSLAPPLPSMDASFPHQAHVSGGTTAATSVPSQAPNCRGATYVFRNDTGLPTIFWTVRQATGAGGGRDENYHSRHGRAQNPVLEALPGATVPFSVDQHRHVTHETEGNDAQRDEVRRREYDAVHTLFVRLGGSLDWLELSSLPLSRVGIYTYSFFPPTLPSYVASSSCASKIVWEVASEEGRRVLTLRSAVRLHNSTGLPLQVRCVGGKEIDYLYVGPWAVVSLPLSWAGRQGIITLRPTDQQNSGTSSSSQSSNASYCSENTIKVDVSSEEDQFAWSGALWDEPEAAFGSATTLRSLLVCPLLFPKSSTCVADSGQEHPLMLHLAAAEHTGQEGDYVVHIYAGATLVNLLPVPVRYAWRERFNRREKEAGKARSLAGEIKTGILASGEEKGLHFADIVGLGAEVSFKLHGGPAYEALGRTRWVSLGTEERGKEGDREKYAHELEMRDEAGNVFVILAELERRGPNGLRVTLYVDVWVRNKSGLSLVYGEPRRGRAVETLGGPVTTDVVMSAVQEGEVVEEVFEVRVQGRRQAGRQEVETRWGTELGRPLLPKEEWRLPSSRTWAWRDPAWKVDGSGQVSEEEGWESSRLDFPDAFKPARCFNAKDRIWRRRWLRRRSLVASKDRDVEVAPAEEGGNGVRQGLFLPGVLPFQPRARSVTSTLSSSATFSSSSLSTPPSHHGQRRSPHTQVSPPTSRQQQGNDQIIQQLVLKIGDSQWSPPLDVSLEGAGGAFQVIGNRWGAVLEDSRLCHTLYELAYRVTTLPPPWDRTRLVTIQARYVLRNEGARPVLVGQLGARVPPIAPATGKGEAGEQKFMMELVPGESRPLHWPNFRLQSLLVLSFPPSHFPAISDTLPTEGTARNVRYSSSGGIDIAALSDTPVIIRPSVPSPSFSASAPLPRLVRVQVALGEEDEEEEDVEAALSISLREIRRPRYALIEGTHGNMEEGEESGRRRGGEEKEEDGEGAPLLWLENRSSVTVWYGQAGGEVEDALPPAHAQIVGWDHPLPSSWEGHGADGGEGGALADGEGDRMCHVRLSLAPPTSSLRRTTASTVIVSPGAVGSSRTLEIPASGGASGTRGREGAHSVTVQVVMNGPAKILRVLDLVPSSSPPPSSTKASSLSSLRHRGHDKTRRSVGTDLQLSPSGRKEKMRDVLRMRLALPAVILSLVDDTPEEVLVLGLEDVVAQAVKGGGEEGRGGLRSRLTVGSFQVDNHMARAHFAVVLRPADDEHALLAPHPSSSPSSLSSRPPSVRFDMHVGPPHPSLFAHIRMLRVNIRRVILNLDQSTVLAVQRMGHRMKGEGEAGTEAVGKIMYLPCQDASRDSPAEVAKLYVPPIQGEVVRQGCGGSPTPGRNLHEEIQRKKQRRPKQGVKVLVEELRIEPLSVNLSLSRPRESPEDVYVGLKPNKMLSDMLNRLDEARLNLHPFEVSFLLTPASHLLWLARVHYAREVKRHVFSMLGSLRALGKPVTLIRGIGKGASDFVSQPIQSLVRSVELLDPEIFFQGVGRGTDSLLKHTVGGVASSASCVMENVGKQLSCLAFDKEYRLARERGREGEAGGGGGGGEGSRGGGGGGRPADVLEGLGLGGKRLMRGLVDGVTGVVAAPVRGAEREGFRGMVKGMGKGMLGLVVKPVVGLADAASDVLQGVQGTAGAALTAEALSQLRPKRAVYGEERRLKPYDMADAQAQMLFERVRGREGRRKGGKRLLARHEEWYCDYAEIGRSRGGVVVLSTARVLFLNEEGILHYSLSWREVVLAELQVPTRSEERLGLVLHVQRGVDGGLRRFLVPCETVGHAKALKGKVDQGSLSFRSSGGEGGLGGCA